MKTPIIPSSEISPNQVYLSRRDFMKAAGVIAGSVALVACAVQPGKSTPSGTNIGTQVPSTGDIFNT